MVHSNLGCIFLGTFSNFVELSTFSTRRVFSLGSHNGEHKGMTFRLENFAKQIMVIVILETSVIKNLSLAPKEILDHEHWSVRDWKNASAMPMTMTVYTTSPRDVGMDGSQQLITKLCFLPLVIKEMSEKKCLGEMVNEPNVVASDGYHPIIIFLKVSCFCYC